MGNPTYWRGLEELEQSPEFLAQATKEFPTDMSIQDALKVAAEEADELKGNRRDFLKIMGFGLSAAALAACTEGPVKKAIPYVTKPDDLVPGVANWYASTTSMGVSVLVRTREGRPIKLEGNPDSPLTRGGLSAVGQASLLDLYDADRLRGPMKGKNAAGWEVVDGEIREKLDELRAAGARVYVVSGAMRSPSLDKAIAGFLAGFGEGGRLLRYQPLSASALAKAHGLAFGKAAAPSIHFDRASVIASFSCDFLGTWLDPVRFAADYIVNRNPDKPMSRHFQFESLMSLTGANADLRFPLNPSQQGVALLNLHNKVASQLGAPAIPGVPAYDVAMSGIEKAAEELVTAARSGQGSLVVCGTNDVAQQAVVAAINNMLGNYGKTLDLANAAYYGESDDEAFAQLVADMKAGQVGGVFFLDSNPAYASPFGADFEAALAGVGLSVSFASKTDETSALCQYTCPDHHFLESWGDVQQTEGQFSLMQPTIHPLFDTRQAGESFLRWSGNDQLYRDYVKANWEQSFVAGAFPDFFSFWNETLRKGVHTAALTAAAPAYAQDPAALATMANSLKEGFAIELPEDKFELTFFPKVAILDGKHANNPWLQELPDPITKVSWDNYVTIPHDLSTRMSLKNGDVLEVSVGGQAIYMPIVVQPGQAKNTLGIALGYGRKLAGRVATHGNGEKRGDKQIAGTNVYPFTSVSRGAVSYTVAGVSVARTGETYPLALTQTFDTLFDPAKGVQFGNDYDRTERIIEETTYASYTDGTYRERVKVREDRKKHLVSLWDSHFEDPETAMNIHWKMAIDLNKCTGCGACVVACHAENNVPVVGKDEVRRRRNMHWLRIDRYYSGSTENPDVVFQPMLCQHCDNAPCETVCPVLATIHSDEGLNQMSYNRCVGTRYCANNCPYKVRRFNWFNYWNDKPKFGDFYTHNDLGRLALNPDVTVRFRGVMEKCSFCVQRLQEAKLRAKINADSTFAKPEDGAVRTACQQSCPTGAIVFGDFNDPNSAVSKAYRDSRSYAVLEDVKTLPSVQYQTLVRNRTKAEGEQKEAERRAAQTYS
ncbi:MAG: TAT-variant-translocated molybdopterin oxidoreductase [Bacteroidia bacterium]